MTIAPGRNSANWAPRRSHAAARVAGPNSMGGAEDSEGHYRQALALAEPLGMRPLVAHCNLGLAKLHGNRGRAEERFSTATARHREMDMAFWLEQAAAEMDQL